VYQLYSDNLAGLTAEQNVYVPASEIIHDRMNTFYHPLIGISPLRACAMTAAHGLKNLRMSERLFENFAQPSGILTSAVTLSAEQAKAIQEMWQQGFTGANEGKVAVLGADLKYQQLSFKPSDMELVSQLKLTSEMICSCFHIPPFKVGVGAYPPYGNVQAGNVQYYSDCLQVLIESIESLMDEGLDLPADLGIEFDVDSLLRMDTLTTVEVASKSVGSANMSPNESRKRYYNLPPVTGGDSPYLQQQNFSLEALAKRDASADPFVSSAATTQARLPESTEDRRMLSSGDFKSARSEFKKALMDEPEAA
jgi:HK97 family phage portal protein